MANAAMEQFVEELKKQLSFKDTTMPGDIVLLSSDEPRTLVYALVMAIERDPGRKESWWNVRMQVLTVPPQEVVWTLREPQFTGQEIFTFNGIKHFMKAVSFGPGPATSPGPEEKGSKRPVTAGRRLRVVK